MKIDIIDSLKTFQALESNWNTVYAADPQAQFFLSWAWLLGKLKRYDEFHQPWFILAAKTSEASDYVAFFPLLISVEEPLDAGCGFYNKLSMAGRAEADHVGFICLPEYEAEVPSAFAKLLQQQERWSVFELDNILRTNMRMKSFLNSFAKEGFKLDEHRYINDLDDVDCSIIPYVPLSESWEEYLQSISTNTRQKIRRLLRKVEASNEFYLTQTNAENLDRQIEILLELWKANWEDRKGADLCRKILTQTNYMLRHCFAHDCLYLPVLWREGKPIGAIAILLDFSKKTALFLLGARDDTVKDLPPGTLLHAYSIRYAIQNSFKVYDFLMGNEAYKYSFGAQERRMTIVVIHRTPNQPPPSLDLRTIPEALQISAFYHRSNRLVEAEQGYRQILAVQPHSDALYGLGVVMQRKGEYQAAERLLQELIQLQPDAKAWFSLGTLYQAQAQLPEAEKAYQQALALQPEISAISLAIYHNLGYTLQQQGRWEEAIACYEKARELQPNSLEAEAIWANALYAQGRLEPEKQAHYAAMNDALGNKRSQAGDLNVACEYYCQAIAMNPELADAHYHLGVTLQAQGNCEAAIACYQKAQDLQPDFIAAEVRSANLLYLQGLLPPDKQADYAQRNYDLGNQFQQAGDFKAAIEYFQQAIAMNPTSAETYCKLGAALQKQGNQASAIDCYQKAQELQPDYLEPQAGVANALYAQRKLDVKTKLHYAAMNYELGQQYKQVGDLSSAIEYYQQAIIMNPALAEAREQLRLTKEAQNNIKIKVSRAKR